MENFFIEDRFYSDLEDYIDDCFDGGYAETPEEAIDGLPDDWSIRVMQSKLEPMFQVDRDEINSVLMNHFFDKHEDRFPHDRDDEDSFIESALYDCINVDQLNKSIPELYYPTTFTTITKQDLLDYLND